MNLGVREEWFERAKCRNLDSATASGVFFPEDPNAMRPAKRYCLGVDERGVRNGPTCPVIEQCLNYAIRTDSWDGVFGGQTPPERRNTVRRRKAAAARKAS